MSKAVVGRLVMQAMIDAGRVRTGTQQIKGELRGLKGSVASTGAALKGIGTALPVMAVVAGFTQMIRANEQFKQSLQSSFAVMDDLTPKMKESMRRMAHEAAYQTKFTAEDSAKSFYYLASAGLSPEQQKAALLPSMQFSMAGMFDAARGVDILTDSVTALGLASKDPVKYMENLVHVSDAIVKAATKANATVEQFGEALMNKGALAAKQMGYDVEEALSAMMVFANKGFAKGEEAGQAYWMVLRDLKNKAVENEAAFKAMGVSVFDASGKARHLWDITRDMERALGGKSTRQQTKDILGLGFSQRSVAPILSMIGESKQLLESYNTLLGATGKTADVANKQLTNLSRGWHDLKVAMQQTFDISASRWGDNIGMVLIGVASVLEKIEKTQIFRLFKNQERLNAQFRGPDPVKYDLKPGQSLMDEVLGSLSTKPNSASAIKKSKPAGFDDYVPPINRFQEQWDQYQNMIDAGDANARNSSKLTMERIQHMANWDRNIYGFYKGLFGKGRTDLQREFAFNMEGITDTKEQGLWKQWANNEITSQELRSELQLLQTLQEMAKTEAEITKQKRDQEQMAKALAREQKSQADQIRRSLDSPYEKAFRKYAEMKKLVDSGALSEEDYDRAMKGVKAEMNEEYLNKARMKVPEYTPVSSKTFGSAEAYSAIASDLRSGGQKQLLDVAKKQLEEDKKTAESTGRIAKIMQEEKTEVIDFAGI